VGGFRRRNYEDHFLAAAGPDISDIGAVIPPGTPVHIAGVKMGITDVHDLAIDKLKEAEFILLVCPVELDMATRANCLRPFIDEAADDNYA
jgi:hypothetical protein